MIKKMSIREKMIAGILLGCLLPLFVGSFYIKDRTENWLYNDFTEQTSLILSQSAGQVDSMLAHTQKLVEYMAVDPRIVNADGSINSYVDFDPDEFQPKQSEKETAIRSMFKDYLIPENFVTFISFGTEQGGYIEYPDFQPVKPYDPRSRGWYQATMETDESLILEPYQTQVTKELVISVDKRVTKDGKTIGVIDATVSLDNIMKEISAIPYDKSGNICILSPKDVFINCPENQQWLMKSIEELNLDLLDHVQQYNGKSFEGTIDGVDKVLTVYVSPYSGWKYISVIDRSVVMEQAKTLTEMLSLILLVTGLIITIMILLISREITKPIRRLTQTIKKMATFQFDEYEQRDLKEDTYQKNEIGEISCALSTMQDNFLELKNSVAVMDEEIQKINIDDTSIHQLSLSENNPFAGVAASVNSLLLRVHRYIGQIKAYSEEINFLAEHDHLTNLPNRRSFNELLHRELTNGAKGAVLLLDMDNFKSINDSLGHIFGDRVLRYISSELEAMANTSIIVSRFGGDEFLILYKFDNNPLDLTEYVERIFGLFQKTITIEGNEIQVEFSMGISVFPDDSNHIEQIIMNADLALYHVKNSGKNSFAYFNNVMADHLKFKIDVKKILIQAIEDEGFKMVYQPKIHLKTGMVTGFEALLRLKDHNLSPAEFIAIAEENGLIIQLGRMVTRMVIVQSAKWNEIGLDTKPVSINFSALQINDKGYKSFLMDLLSQYQVKPDNIVIEITEHIFLENKEATIEFINDLKACGIKFAIDDFGAEYSSLSYLASLPIDELKLDRDLNQRFLETKDEAVMGSLIAFVHSLNMNIVAEGIEEFEQVKKLQESNCDCVQGFYFSRPLEAEDVPAVYNRIYDV